MYPVCVCAIEQNQSGACFLRKNGEINRLEVPRALARFLARLDGKTDPYELAPNFSREQMNKLLSMLEEMEYITTKCWNGSLLSAQITLLWLAQRRIPAAVRRICKALSMLLAVSWLPILILGLIQFLNGNWGYSGSGTLGIVLGFLLGIPLHEMAHAAICVGAGGRLVRAGVLTQFILIPGAFVELDYVHLPRSARIHTLMSGVEVNALMAGLAFLAGSQAWGEFYTSFGLANLIFAIINLGTYFIGLDGAKALSELIGSELDLSLDILLDYPTRASLRKQGITGRARIAATQILSASQFAILVILILNLKEILSWIF